MQTENFEFTEELFTKMMQGAYSGLSLADLTNMNPEVLEGFYALASDLYTAGDYKKAEKIFQLLCLYSGKEYKYLMGLAGCQQATEQYAEAIGTYTYAGMAETLKNPIPFYHATQCYLKLGDVENAINALKGILTMGDANDPAHKKCLEKSEHLLIALEKK